MTDHGEGHKSARQRLEGMKTLDEVLETAMGFERTAEAFYSQLIARVSKPLRDLVAELAEEEKRHLELFQSVKNHRDTEAHLEDLIAVPPNDHKFSDFVQAPTLPDNPDDQAILQYALAREQAAHEQYSDLALATPEGPLKNLFKYLADEELRHKGDLEKRYYEIVHSGGV